MTPSQRQERLAFRTMTLEIIQAILSRAEDPAAAARYITSEILEISGARTVLLLRCGGARHHEVLDMSPHRRRESIEVIDVENVAVLVHNLDTATLWNESAAPAQIQKILKTLGQGDVIGVPLFLGKERIGGLVLMGIPSREHHQGLINCLETLSPLLALILQHSQHFAVQREALLASREQQESILSTAMDGIWILDETGTILEVNAAICHMSGYSREELLGSNVSLLETKESREQIAEHIALIMQQREHRFETCHRRKDGTIIDVEVSAQYLPFQNGRVVAFHRDISERKASEQQLRESEANFRTMFDTVPDGVLIAKAQTGKFLFANPAICHMLGYRLEEILSMGTEDLHPAEDVPRHKAHFREAIGRKTEVAETPLRRKDGTCLLCSCITQPIELARQHCVMGFFHDVTQERQTQERLLQAEKMQAVGQLAGGIAHDFNNQLTGVLGYADLLMQRLDDPLLKRFAESIKVAATRSADLTRQLLAFSRKGKYLSVPTDLHKVIVEVVELLRRSIDKRIAIQLHLDANPTSVLGDPTQLQNALLNLGLNARDAMPEGGMIQFSTRILVLPSGGPEDLPAGRYIQTSVIDTGCGMDETVRRRLFEPFFTTKEVGKGTGLGLASVYGTVRNHGGNIQVESTPKKGSAFHLLLPLATETESPCSTTSQVVGPILAQRRILIVDDEALLLGLLQTMLQGMGAQVTIQSDPVVALEHYRQHWQDFDLVILDMVMPGLGGKDLFAAMKAANPNILALLASGYSLGSEAQAILDAGVRGFIQKPFHQAQLAEAIQRVFSHQATPR